MKNHFFAAMYLRLSRDDALDRTDGTKEPHSLRFESNSIGNQRELIRAYIHEQQDIELYDSYVDDGFSGSNFDRPEFKRMINDMEEGRVNCVIVKDLSRFGRDYIECGRYIQKIFPALGVRFIALTDHYDSFHTDVGESGIVLPVKNFINDSYCRDISAKVKSQFEIKRKQGACIAPFALYGYRKSESNKNKLVIDEYAAEIVKNIFAWKIQGMAVFAIAKKLNDCGILSPAEYKKSMGCNYRGGFFGTEHALWSSSTIKRILTNETYLGHLVQGKTEKINYKVKKSVEKPREEWIKVEHVHEPVISENDFHIVQNLLRTDSRISPVTEQNGLFTGLLFCGDCGEQMIRRVNRYRNKQMVYEICSTKNRGEGCSRHSIEEEKLKELVTEVIQKYANYFMEERKICEKAGGIWPNVSAIGYYQEEIARLKKEHDKYKALCLGLEEDLKREMISHEEKKRLYAEFRQKAVRFAEAGKRQELLIKPLTQKSIISEKQIRAMRQSPQLKEIDRYAICTMVKEMRVFEKKRMEIVFDYIDPYRVKFCK